MRADLVVQSKKSTRKEAISALIAYADSHADCQELSAVFRFLQAPPVRIEGSEWLYSALAPSVGHWMCYVHVEGGIAYATDGHRLHAKPTTAQDGVYGRDGGALGTLVASQYPAPTAGMKKALKIPDSHGAWQVIPYYHDLPRGLSMHKGIATETVTLPCGALINAQYWLDAIGNGQPPYMRCAGAFDPVYIRVGESTLAQIAPLRI